jgi:hypothetical protein
LPGLLVPAVGLLIGNIFWPGETIEYLGIIYAVTVLVANGLEYFDHDFMNILVKIFGKEGRSENNEDKNPPPSLYNFVNLALTKKYFVQSTNEYLLWANIQEEDLSYEEDKLESNYSISTWSHWEYYYNNFF